MRRHRWGARAPVTPHLTIRVCVVCGLEKHSHHEVEGGRDVHWATFHFPDGTAHSRRNGTPECEGSAAIERAA
jgi:hypothetical protein